MMMQQAPALEQGWSESKAPELVKWEKPGDNIAGILTAIEAVVIDGKKVPQITIALGDRRFKALMTYDLRQKITHSLRGCQLRITYLGQDENIRGGANNEPMKVFSVQYKGTASPSSIPGGPITDEDIPF